MATLFALSLAALLGSASSALCLPSDSCPKLSDAKYCPVNDVKEHGDINRDVSQIKTYLAETPPNYVKAKEVYTNGMYSSKGTSNRTLQGLAQSDMTSSGKYANAFYSGALDLYGSTNAVWEDIMIACFGGSGTCSGKSDTFRKTIINKGCIGIVTAYTTYEMGGAVWKGADGQTSDVGAPYAWDEAAAFYIGNIQPVVGDGYTGSAPGNLYSPYEFNWKRDKDFPGGTAIHTAAIPIMNYGLINLRGSAYNAANVQSAQTAMYKIFSIAAIRAVIKYSWTARGDGTLNEEFLAEGWAYWRSASGYISTVNKATVQEIDALLDWSLTSIPATTPCEIKTKVESMYKALGISCAMVGVWNDAPAGSCLASPCSDTGNTNTLLAGSTTYVDMCKVAASEPMSSTAWHGAPAFTAIAAAAVAAACDFV